MASKRSLVWKDLGSGLVRPRESHDDEDLEVPLDLKRADGSRFLPEYWGPRDPPFEDRVRGGCYVIAEDNGLWHAGTAPTGTELNPERLSSAYQTLVSGSYTSMTGTVAANDTLTGSTAAWTSRLVSINTGAKTFVLSLYGGTSAGAGAETLTASLGNTLNGVTVTAGVVTNYGDTSGEKAPFINAGGVTCGYFTCIGSAIEETLSDVPGRFPALPTGYSRTFNMPYAELARGAVCQTVLSGVWLNTTPDSCVLYTVLNIGEAIFGTLSLGANNHRVRMRFPSPSFPLSTVEVPFVMRILLVPHRTEDRTEGLVGLVVFETDSAVWGGAGSYRVGLQRGSDRLVSPTTFTGYLFESGDDTVNKRTERDVAVWAGVGTDSGLGRGVATSGEMYAKFFTYQTSIVRGPIG